MGQNEASPTPPLSVSEDWMKVLDNFIDVDNAEKEGEQLQEQQQQQQQQQQQHQHHSHQNLIVHGLHHPHLHHNHHSQQLQQQQQHHHEQQQQQRKQIIIDNNKYCNNVKLCISISNNMLNLKYSKLNCSSSSSNNISSKSFNNSSSNNKVKKTVIPKPMETLRKTIQNPMPKLILVMVMLKLKIQKTILFPNQFSLMKPLFERKKKVLLLATRKKILI